MTSKIHHLVDGRGAPMVVVVSAGQSGDSPMLPVLLDHLSVPRIGPELGHRSAILASVGAVTCGDAVAWCFV